MKGDAIRFLHNYAERNQILVNQIIKPAGTAKIMSSADDISSWYEAVQLYEVNRIDEAIEKFKSVKQNARMLLNTGCCYLRKNDLQTAGESFGQAVKNDPHQALGFFMLGLTQYFQNKLEDALKSFEKSLTLLRGNKFVDYRQLGFKFQLYACEILTNIAGTHLRLNDLAKAQEVIQQAYEQRADKKHERIINDVDRLKSKRPKLDLFYPPKSEVFRPAKALVANVEKKDYLGAAKVISTDSEEDCYACFSGIKDKVIEQKKAEQNSPKQNKKLITKIEAMPEPAKKKSPETKKRVSAIPKGALPQLSIDQPDGPLQQRSMSVGARPNKPLPALIAPKKELPKLEPAVETKIEEKITATVEKTVESTPASSALATSDDIELEIQYNFISKVRLPKGFTIADLQNIASQQKVPTHLEFRLQDVLGRQSQLTDDGIKSLEQQKIHCYPTTS